MYSSLLHVIEYGFNASGVGFTTIFDLEYLFPT